jgi:hypothetical protein
MTYSLVLHVCYDLHRFECFSSAIVLGDHNFTFSILPSFEKGVILQIKKKMNTQNSFMHYTFVFVGFGQMVRVSLEIHVHVDPVSGELKYMMYLC